MQLTSSVRIRIEARSDDTTPARFTCRIEHVTLEWCCGHRPSVLVIGHGRAAQTAGQGLVGACQSGPGANRVMTGRILGYGQTALISFGVVLAYFRLCVPPIPG